MLNYILFVIGLILIGFSIIIIRKDLKKSEIELEEINRIEKNVKEYYKLTEEMIEIFDDVINNKIEEINAQKMNFINSIEKNRDENKNYINDKDYYNIIEKILELQDIGLSTEEIARKLNMGIREIEIILKMYRSKNMDKNI